MDFKLTFAIVTVNISVLQELRKQNPISCLSFRYFYLHFRILRPFHAQSYTNYDLMLLEIEKYLLP
jgi:hypothetical protein